MTAEQKRKLAKELLREGVRDERVEFSTGVSLVDIIGLRAELATQQMRRTEWFSGRALWRP